MHECFNYFMHIILALSVDILFLLKLLKLLYVHIFLRKYEIYINRNIERYTKSSIVYNSNSSFVKIISNNQFNIYLKDYLQKSVSMSSMRERILLGVTCLNKMYNRLQKYSNVFERNI